MRTISYLTNKIKTFLFRGANITSVMIKRKIDNNKVNDILCVITSNNEYCFEEGQEFDSVLRELGLYDLYYNDIRPATVYGREFLKENRK